ncbi:hypothetical protein EIN_131230 [Entamoeba invadens IP1]|uniref:Uncharacterized protein n=1 Tax=Entamoeba invadens IP1 TaxID=370355 RepID=A0A0A1UD94_ENTIV|nr:hypothetical protein EIN_131230 [Entamoeba invadens IP1]ELP94324.1 hypothetical protein EIN_131230 [Entamoeba invadens IP1]|eukprot:XP_004261095.1 hypothetical protein EIN_131230 [Entamoeba invadens IP1]
MTDIGSNAIFVNPNSLSEHVGKRVILLVRIKQASGEIGPLEVSVVGKQITIQQTSITFPETHAETEVPFKITATVTNENEVELVSVATCEFSSNIYNNLLEVVSSGKSAIFHPTGNTDYADLDIE